MLGHGAVILGEEDVTVFGIIGDAPDAGARLDERLVAVCVGGRFEAAFCGILVQLVGGVRCADAGLGSDTIASQTIRTKMCFSCTYFTCAVQPRFRVRILVFLYLNFNINQFHIRFCSTLGTTSLMLQKGCIDYACC